MTTKFYHISAKKATVTLLFLLLLFPFAAIAKESADPGYGEQQRFWNQINVPNAWDITTGSRRVVVAVVDTGFDTQNQDLSQNIWTNSKEIVGNGVDDDRNGYIDDVHGWNFVENTNDVRTPVASTSTPSDAVHHGSLVAGLIGAQGDNGVFGAGLNWQVSLMSLRAISNSGSGTTGQVIEAINYAVANGADVINMSFVGDFNDSALRQSFLRAYDAGVVVVAAAGNDRVSGKGDLDVFPEFPACYDRGDTANWVLGVASINVQNQLSRFSNYGSCVDLVAPGERIFSTKRYAPEFGLNDQFNGIFNGTSFAAPMVSGAAALIKAIRPDWKAGEITNILLSSADPVEANNPDFIGKLGRGRLNVGRAVALAKAALPAVTVPEMFSEVITTSSTAIAPTIASPVTENTLWYAVGNKIFSLNLDDSKNVFLTSIRSGKMIDFTSSFDPALKQTILAALMQERSLYRVELFNQSGVLIGTYLVDSQFLSKNKNIQIKGVKLLVNSSGEYSAVFNTVDIQKKTAAVWVQPLGKKIAKVFSFVSPVLGWDIDSASNTLLTAELRGKKLVVTEFALDGQGRSEWVLPKVDEVIGFRSGHLFSSDSKQAVVVVKQAGKYSGLTIDVASKSYMREALAGIKIGEQWNAAVFSGKNLATDAVVFWKNTGGRFALKSGRGENIHEIVLPKLIGIRY